MSQKTRDLMCEVRGFSVGIGGFEIVILAWYMSISAEMSLVYPTACPGSFIIRDGHASVKRGVVRGCLILVQEEETEKTEKEGPLCFLCFLLFEPLKKIRERDGFPDSC